MRPAFWLLLVVACGKAPPNDTPPPVTAPEVPIDDLLDAASRLTVQRSLAAAEFDGACPAQLTRLVAIQPLADGLRDGLAALPASARARFDLRINAAKPEVDARLDKLLAAETKTRADVERGAAAIKATCLSDPQFVEAMRRAQVEIAVP